MNAYLGFDTSNYTTSIAIYIPETNTVIQKKRILHVKHGNRGLRQSEAVFQHTVNLAELTNELFDEINDINILAVCASSQPRLEEGSYMPCFLVGKTNGITAARSLNVPFYQSSHQHGHILASLYCVDQLDLIKEKFLAFHLSGGTTELLYVEPDEKEILNCTLYSSSTDVKAGQIIDRSGVLLGLDFPCGPELEKLSNMSNRSFKIKPSIIGKNCSLSGIENKIKKMIDNNEDKCDIAKFTIDSIIESVSSLSKIAVNEFGDIPIVFAGGVSSNQALQNTLKKQFKSYFSTPAFSADNAVGMAVMAYLKHSNDNFKCFTN